MVLRPRTRKRTYFFSPAMRGFFKSNDSRPGRHVRSARRGTCRLLSALAMLLTAGGLALVTPETSLAAGLTVNSTVDAVDANPGDGICATAAGECTLRAAIEEANALPGPDTVNLGAGTYTITIGAGDFSPSSDLNISDELEIRGAGANQTLVDGGYYSRVIATFWIHSATVAISDLTLMNFGDPLVIGGAILNDGGTLTLNDVVVTHNVASRGAGVANLGGLTIHGGAFIQNGAPGGESSDGAISNAGTMTLEGVTFRGNGSGSGGGAIGNDNTAVLNNVVIADNGTEGVGGGIYNGWKMTVTNSTLTGNDGSAIFNDSTGTLVVANTTVAGNSGVGSGIWNRGAASLTNVTMSGNHTSSTVGGGIYNGFFGLGNLVLKNSIVAGNSGGNCAGAVPITSAGHNLSSDSSCGFTAAGDLQDTDPLLGPLADNGGPTQTMVLLPGSPAIDAGDNVGCPSTDQRGFFRPFDGDADGQAVCDIGAYEFGSSACAGDVTGDGEVDASDVKAVARAMHSTPGSERWRDAADVNGDGVIDVADLRAVVRARKAHACA